MSRHISLYSALRTPRCRLALSFVTCWHVGSRYVQLHAFHVQFYAMVDFCNPGALGDPNEFRKTYARPILQSREPDATPAQRELGTERNEALSGIVNQFILRRTNALLSAHLPPKARTCLAV